VQVLSAQCDRNLRNSLWSETFGRMHKPPPVVICMSCVKGKCKISLCLINYSPRHEYVRGMEVQFHRSWSRHFMGVSGQLHIYAALPLQKGPKYPLVRRMDRPQSWCGRWKERKNILLLSGMEPQLLNRAARIPALYRLLYAFCRKKTQVTKTVK
jgi:hypothetical protein